jgi:hypothetical protein
VKRRGLAFHAASLASERVLIHPQRLTMARAGEKRFANRFSRFAQKTGFGERRSDAKSPRVKIFSLPKSATQSPRNALSSDMRESRRRPKHVDRPACEVRKHLRHRRFLQS